LVRLAVDEGDVLSARIYAIARLFMLRVASELFPLQACGAQDLPRDDIRWHSRVEELADGVRITLSRRKASCTSVTILRRCVCTSQRPLLCGSCALGALLREHRLSGRGPAQPLLAGLRPEAVSAALRRRAGVLGLAHVSWHSFRRGYARDLLRDGGSLARIARAGGWKSAALLHYLPRDEVDAAAAADLLFRDSDSDSA
jgi:hypothetical protein